MGYRDKLGRRHRVVRANRNSLGIRFHRVRFRVPSGGHSLGSLGGKADLKARKTVGKSHIHLSGSVID